MSRPSSRFDSTAQELEFVREQVDRSQRMLSTLRRINQLKASAVDPTELIQGFCEVLTDNLGYFNAWIALRESDGSLRACAQSKISYDVYQRFACELGSGPNPLCIEHALHQHAVFLEENPQKACGQCPLASSYGDRGSMSCRIEHEGIFFGVMTVAVPSSYVRDSEHADLFADLSRDLGFALHRFEDELRLKDSQRELVFAQSLARLGTWRFDLKSGWVQASAMSRSIYGLAEDEPMTIDRVQQIPLKQDRERLDRSMRELIEQGQPYDVEFRIRRASDGAIRHVHSLASYDADRQLIIGTIQDVTERVQAERRIHEDEAYLRSILQTTADGFWVLDRHGRVLEVNEAYCDMTGYDREQLLSMNVWDLDATENPSDTAERIARIMHEGSEIFETLHWNQAGQTFPVEVTATWLDIRGGQFICFCRDLTRRKHQERYIGLLGEMLDAAPAAIMIHGVGGEIHYANRVNGEIHGYEDRDEFLSLRLEALDTPESAQEIPDRMQQIQEGGSAHFEVEHFRKDGSRFPLEVMAKAIEWQGKPALLSIAMDISERKRARQALIDSEERNRLLSEMTMEGILLHKNGVAIDLNPSLASLFGFPRDALLGRDFSELVHPDDLPRVRENLSKEIAEPYTIRMRHRSGEYLHVEIEARNFIKDGDTWRATAVRDLSERLKAEQALKESESKLRSLIKHLHAGVVVHAPDTRILFSNLQASRLLGLGMEQLTGKAALDPDWCFLDEHGTVLAHEDYPVNRVIGSGHPVQDMVAGVNRPNHNDVVWLLVNAFPEYDSAGELYQVVVTFVDITARVEAKEALAHSRDLMQYIIEHANSAVAVHDREMRYVFVSQQYLKAFGLEGQDVLGKHHYEVFPNLPEKWKESHRKALQGEVSRGDRDAFVQDNGEVNWSRWECRPWYEEPGRIGGFVVYTEIITERVLSERALRSNEEFQRAIIASSPLAIITTDTEGRVESWNDAATQIFGWRRDEVMGRFPPYIKAEQRSFFGAMRQRILKGETFSQLEVTRIRKSGEAIEISISTGPIRDHKGEIVRILAILEDITEKKRLQAEQEQILQELKLKKEAAESSNRAKDDFLAVMSHEMRTPLNAILGFSHLLMDDIVESGPRSFLESISEAGEQLLHLIENILNYARLDRGSLQPTFTTLPLYDLCESIFESIRPSSHGLELRLHNGMHGWDPVPAGMEVCCDVSMLTRLLQNLLTNACKYTVHGSITLVLGMQPHSAGLSRFRFVVEDTGIGISEADRARLFKPFSQVDSTYTRNFDGAGLGLATCQKLVDILDGKIGLESDLAKGSRFWFELPLEIEAPLKAMENPVLKESVMPTLSRNVRALVVDDRIDNRLLVKSFIERLGSQCDMAESGEVALEMCQQTPYDLILMDLCMPDVDGFTTLHRLRAMSGPNQHTPVVAVTADASEETPERCLGAGMAAYLSKPIRMPALAETLRRLQAD